MNFWERGGYNAENDAKNKGNAGQTYNADVKSNNTSAQNEQRGNATADGKYTEQEVRDKFEQYSGKDENQLMSELARTVARMKSEGSFDSSAIENMYNTAAPFLNDEQRKRMRAIIDMLVR